VISKLTHHRKIVGSRHYDKPQIPSA